MDEVLDEKKNVHLSARNFINLCFARRFYDGTIRDQS